MGESRGNHPTRPILKPLDATYQTRALPPGTARYWSWLFAAAEARAPLLGIYALGAEWQALMDPATEISVAHLKLAWWQEEMHRLKVAVTAAAAQVSGAPLERGSDLEPQSRALWGDPMALASQLADDVQDETGLRNCTSALAAADYLSKAIRDYRREARAGRVPFAIDELMEAGVDNDDLATDPPPPRLQSYFDGLRKRAAQYFQTAAEMLPRAQRARHRHLLVLAALGQAHLNSRAPVPERRRLKDMLLAWTTARRAH